jgi:small subunit ribosomal protein S17
MDWKARRRLERSRQPAEARPQQSPEERAKVRGEARSVAARRRTSYRKKQRSKHEAGTGTQPLERESAGRKTRQGRVVSSKPDKTITVQIEVARRHPQYEKIVRRSRTLHAHDARNEAGEGDLVRIVETRPLSRTKRWRLVEILEKAQ